MTVLQICNAALLFVLCSVALTAPPAGHPEDGQNEAGDKVVLREPDESGVLEYVCVEAGEPGTWSAGHTWTAD